MGSPTGNRNDGPYLIAAAVMSLMGAFFWAIRGTTGFGGETGGTLAGFGWALLWCAFSQMCGDVDRRPYAQPWIIPAITAGIGFGGFTGYGVYIAWLNGKFYLDYPFLVRETSVWPGYAMLFLCGLHWGGNTGCLMAWCAPARKLGWKDWTERIIWGAAGAAAVSALVRIAPQLFLPYFSEGIYSDPAHKTCQRALASIRTIAPHVGLFLGLLGYEVRRRDRRAVGLILTMALGFALPFAAGGYWQTMHESGLRLDWWKNWEMTIGLFGGLTLGLAMWRFNRPAEGPPPPTGRFALGLFRSGLHLSVPSFIVLGGAYEGWCRIRRIESAGAAHALLFLASVCLPLAIRLWRGRSAADGTGGACISFPATAALLAMIVVAGYSVSIPAEWRLANVVLVTLYTIYIVTSFLLTLRLWRRQMP